MANDRRHASPPRKDPLPDLRWINQEVTDPHRGGLVFTGQIARDDDGVFWARYPVKGGMKLIGKKFSDGFAAIDALEKRRLESLYPTAKRKTTKKKAKKTASKKQQRKDMSAYMKKNYGV